LPEYIGAGLNEDANVREATTVVMETNMHIMGISKRLGLWKITLSEIQKFKGV